MYWYIKRVYDKLKAKGLEQALFKSEPLSIFSFLEGLPSKVKNYVWPVVKEDLGKTFSERAITEVVKIDGVGSGKSTFLVLSLVYGLALMSCLRDPARLYGLMPESKIGFVIMSLRQFQAKEIIYEEVCRILLATKLFKDYYPVSERREAGTTILKFPNNVFLLSGGGSETLPIGLNVLLAVGDEMLWLILKSHKGDSQDQAANIYSALKERIESRFGERGAIAQVSSARAAGLFVEQRYKSCLTDKKAYVTRRAIWESKPGKWGPFFAVRIKTAREAPDLGLKEYAPYPAKDAPKNGVLWVPLCFKPAFYRNPVKFLRDKASIVSVVVKAFVTRPDRIKLNGVRKNPVSIDGIIDPDFKPRDFTYYSHSDLGLNFDKAVVSVGHQESALTVIDLIYKIDPVEEGIVDLSVIKQVFFELEKRGFQFGFISFDQFASIDTIQDLEKRGNSVGIHSVDRDPRSYNCWLEAHYEELIDVPVVEGYLEEVKSLIRLPKGTIDHREDGSKDILDAVAGTTWHCRTLGVGSDVSVGGSSAVAEKKVERTSLGTEDLNPVVGLSELVGGSRRLVRSRLGQMGGAV